MIVQIIKVWKINLPHWFILVLWPYKLNMKEITDSIIQMHTNKKKGNVFEL